MSSSRKRKRTQPSPAKSSADQVINPRSHTPSTLKQFTLAGLPHDSPLLSDLYPGFPHRPPRPARKRYQYTSQSYDPSHNNLTDKSGDEGGDELPDFTTDDDGPIGARTTAGEETDFSSASSSNTSGKRRSKKKELEKDRKAAAHTNKVGVLINTVKRALREGDIPLAKRSFGLLARAKVNGRRVDLRYERLWELGAEIILREGETTTITTEGELKGAVQIELERQAVNEDDDNAERESRQKDRLFARQQANLANLKAFYQHLIQNHPFSKQHPNSTGRPLLEFNIALFSAEMEGVYALHRRGMERIEERDGRGEFYDVEDEVDIIEEEPDDEMDVDGEEEHKAPPTPPREKRKVARVREEKDELRREVLRQMRGIAERMDALLETTPFSRDGEFARLRAMVGLYIADLCVPFGEEEKRAGYEVRDKERQKARKLLAGVRDMGKGVLKKDDEELLKMLGNDDEDDDDEEEEEDKDEEEEDEDNDEKDEESDEEGPQLQFFSSMPA
ncbi:uncharacterized protein PODANS_3_4090 [Podospora anserina S mat+]|uniref:Podospora anserina S mat+ genomic DNA chromosome 3, supercontig 2 n=1 Tax=Podospora anserina (strain S / ATCC MYA-4624 / DSM 980 / FGSC 10383) TaxID=515849 RepID=B2AZ46_PODAN|nr:uncharacterized protein PODANS_3_4090 [Podospora anserina S mat+]CAP70326.1 unnamed protein product [Podospora anserina S mat+]CDP26919.1 Putative protein of unknown function [Podospora anserina S mat+]